MAILFNLVELDASSLTFPISYRVVGIVLEFTFPFRAFLLCSMPCLSAATVFGNSMTSIDCWKLTNWIPRASMYRYVYGLY